MGQVFRLNEAVLYGNSVVRLNPRLVGQVFRPKKRAQENRRKSVLIPD